MKHPITYSPLQEQLNKAAQRAEGATVYAYHVGNPERYGVVEYDESRRAISLEEKPLKPKSSYAVATSIFTTTKSWILPFTSNLQHAANWKSPT